MLKAGRHPQRWDGDLRGHLNLCESCREVVDMATALKELYAAEASRASVPSADAMWWRAELRSRREAVRSAERPLAFAQAFAGAVILGVSTALLVRVVPWLDQHLALASLIIVLIAVAPVALYFAFSDK